MFESAFLQRGVSCEPDFLKSGCQKFQRDQGLGFKRLVPRMVARSCATTPNLASSGSPRISLARLMRRFRCRVGGGDDRPFRERWEEYLNAAEAAGQAEFAFLAPIRRSRCVPQPWLPDDRDRSFGTACGGAAKTERSYSIAVSSPGVSSWISASLRRTRRRGSRNTRGTAINVVSELASTRLSKEK